MSVWIFPLSWVGSEKGGDVLALADGNVINVKVTIAHWRGRDTHIILDASVHRAARAWKLFVPCRFGWSGSVFREPSFLGELRSVVIEERCDCVVQV